ncbi:MAG TPA: hypothetical protein VF600_07075 [Abditibacteriaceae bacterium]|jgi:hypothetical protein
MQASIQFIALDSIEVANPCRADWNLMKGDERTRFCATCTKNVYNLSGMSRTQAEDLVRAKEGELCVRFYRRADGTILTDDCPVGLRAVRRPLKWMTTTVAIFAAPLFTFAAVMTGGRVNAAQIVTSLRQSQPVNTIFNWLQPEPPVGLVAVAGGIAPPPPRTAPPPTLGKAAAAATADISNLQCNAPPYDAPEGDAPEQGQTK